MGTEGEPPKLDESVVRFRVESPEAASFEASKVNHVAQSEQASQTEATESAVEESSRQIPGRELTVFDRVAELEQQLKEAQATVDRLRARETARKQSYRKRHREQVRQYDRLYKRKWRASQRREQDSDPE